MEPGDIHETPKPRKKTAKKKKTKDMSAFELPTAKRSAKKKAPAPQPVAESPSPAPAPVPLSTAEQEALKDALTPATPVELTSLGMPPTTPDTLPTETNPVAAAKAKPGVVKDWAAFLKPLSQGTAEALERSQLRSVDSICELTADELLIPKGEFSIPMLEEVEDSLKALGKEFTPVDSTPEPKSATVVPIKNSTLTRYQRTKREMAFRALRNSR